MEKRKIILVGAGAVGTSFLYSAMNRGIAQEYGIIDLNEMNCEGQVLDFEDGIAVSQWPFTVFKATYADCKDADIVVITAGRPQLPGETRLNMVEGNAKIMKDIATNIKKSGFKGITVIASNPVDVLTLVYQEVTGYKKESVVGSGTSLDSSRLQFELSKELNIAPQSIKTYVLGEHGDSSVSAFHATTINGKSLRKFEEEGKIDPSKYENIENIVRRKAYEIIERKRATFYGIGVCLANICENILRDTKNVIAVGGYLQGEYGQTGFYTGVPAVIGINGIEEIIEIELSSEEQKKFDESSRILKEVIEKAKLAIK